MTDRVERILAVNDLFHAMRPGDLLGGSSRSLAGAIINLGTWGRPFVDLSHVAMLAQNPETGFLSVWESTSSSPLVCEVRRNLVSGVQCHAVAGWVNAYPGRVYHYALRPEHRLDAERAAELGRWWYTRVDAGYDRLGAWRARDLPLRALLRLLGLGREDLHLMFCSEGCAAAWRAAGVWEPPDASAWSPNRLARTAVEVGLVGTRQRIK
jgi:hypothetical protein